MPPRGRPAQARQNPPPSPPQPPSPSPSRSEPESTVDTRSIFNKTFFLHRVSPLYLGSGRDPTLTRPRLDALSRQLRELLVGDTVRGVQVGLEGSGVDGRIGRTGPLQEVTIRWVEVGSFLGGGGSGPDEDAGADLSLDEHQKRGARLQSLWITIRYENETCFAVLLPSLAPSADPAAEAAAAAVPSWTQPAAGPAAAPSDRTVRFLHLPLLLLRMPSPLRGPIVEFLASTFDCHISILKLGTRTLVRSWERWLCDCPPPTRGVVSKDITISLGFHVPKDAPRANGAKSDRGQGAGRDGDSEWEKQDYGLGIRGLAVTIPGPDIGQFFEAGNYPSAEAPSSAPAKVRNQDDRTRRRLAGAGREEGWHWVPSGDHPSPGSFSQSFMNSLARYLDIHLGLDLFHPGVRIVKIDSPAFLLGEKTIKLVTPPPPSGGGIDRPGIPTGAWNLVAGLAEAAAGDEIRGDDAFPARLGG